MLVSLPFTRLAGLRYAAGQKTQARRLLRRQPTGTLTLRRHAGHHRPIWCDATGPIMRIAVVEGDVIAVREPSWIYGRWLQTGGLTGTGRVALQFEALGEQVLFVEPPPNQYATSHGKPGWQLRQATYMPAWAVRSYRRVLAVKFEKLTSVTEADALAEGFTAEVVGENIVSARTAFLRDWTDQNGVSGIVDELLVAVIVTDRDPTVRPRS